MKVKVLCEHCGSYICNANLCRNNRNPWGTGLRESRHGYGNNIAFPKLLSLSPTLAKYISVLESIVWAQARLVLELQLCVCACVCALLLTRKCAAKVWRRAAGTSERENCRGNMAYFLELGCCDINHESSTLHRISTREKSILLSSSGGNLALVVIFRPIASDILMCSSRKGYCRGNRN